ncbi:transposase [Sinorhizobium fredii]|uniref:Transcriptional regulator SyrB protein n=1 Tax=Rhizobium fredii TaxID=380 RepID=A0A2L0HD90_RHIFR|nr:transposase [Sinorhizobium fredii]AUX79470.1 transcriptional regulator SyrB protein [Sinorhizobium fredii]
MSDESNTGAMTAAVETTAEANPRVTKKPRSPQRRKAAAEPAQDKSKASAAKSRRYGAQERAEKLKLIETEISEGKSTLKDAIKSAGISEQTYYQWKRAAEPVEQKTVQGTTSAPDGDEFADLVQLEQENQRLRKLLAEKLRSENADLRKKLGLD